MERIFVDSELYRKVCFSIHIESVKAVLVLLAK